METATAIAIGFLAGYAGILIAEAWDRYVIRKGWKGWNLG